MKIGEMIGKQMRMNTVLGLIAFFTFNLIDTLVSEKAFANDFLYTGTEVKGSAGAGITQSRGSASLDYNPSNMMFTKNLSLRLDISSLDLKHGYIPDDPAREKTSFEVRAIPPSLGLVYQFKQVALGVSFIPTGAGEREFTLSQETDLGAIPVRVVSNQASYRLSAAVAARVNSLLSLGAAVQNLSESSSTQVFLADNSIPILPEGEMVIDTEEQGNFFRILLSTKLNLSKRWELNLVYKNQVQKDYDGQAYSLLEGSEYKETSKVGFLPNEYGVGLSLQLKKLALFGEFRYLSYSQGRAIQNDGLSQNEEDELDLIDVIELAVGIKAKVFKRTKVSLAYAYLPKNIGDGSEGTSEQVDYKVLGPNVGDFKAINRSVLAAGLVYKINPKIRMLSSLNFVSGKRVVDEAYANSGRYDLDIVEISFGTLFHL